MPKKHPTPEMVNDLAQLFSKHNWSGQPIGLSKEPARLPGMVSSNGDDDTCPDGSEPQWVSYKLPDGTWAQKKMCL